VGRVVHLGAHLSHSRGVHLSVDDLRERERESEVRTVSEPRHDDDAEDDGYSRHGGLAGDHPSQPYLILQLAVLEEPELVLPLQVVAIDMVEVYLERQVTVLAQGLSYVHFVFSIITRSH